MDVTSLLPLQGLAPVDAVSIVPGDETILVEAVQFSDRVLVLMAGAGEIITKGMVGRVNGEVLDRVHIVLVSQFVEAGCGFLILFARKKRHVWFAFLQDRSWSSGPHNALCVIMHGEDQFGLTGHWFLRSRWHVPACQRAPILLSSMFQHDVELST